MCVPYDIGLHFYESVYMKMYLLSDNIDTATGLRLAGIDGEVIHTREEVLEALERLTKDRDIAIVLITALLADLAHDTISRLMEKLPRPAVVIIPDRHGKTADGEFAITSHTIVP